MTQQEIAARLQQLRRKKSFLEERDVTQAEVAADTALSVESFSRYENGKRKVPEDAIQILARYYGVTPSYIRYGIKPDTINVGGLEIDRASLVRFSDAELAEARRQIAEEEARSAAETAAPAPARKAANGKRRRPR